MQWERCAQKANQWRNECNFESIDQISIGNLKTTNEIYQIQDRPFCFYAQMG